ncbi:MAG: hypothetical protein WCN92_00590 [Eubacteriales bacterium]
MAETESERSSLNERIMRYEYELILLIFLLLRFVFKNILGFAKYFTEQKIFGLSNKLNIAIGSTVLLSVCIFLAFMFGQLIKKSGVENEKPFLIFVALFFACPATLPFLFDTKSVSGTLLLYPFSLFILAIFLIRKPFFKWLIPFICAIYFVPALFSSEIFFTALRKGAILYVPLILLFLYLDMMKGQLEPGKQKKIFDKKSAFSFMFIVSSLASIGSYIFTLTSSKSYYITFFNSEQHLDGYLAICLLIVSPALAAVCAVLYHAVKNKFSTRIFDVFWRVPILLFLLFRSNYYGLWIPFVLISLFLIIFYSVWQKNSAMLSSVRTVGDYCTEHRFIFYIILIAMASLSNVSSSYLSSTFQNIFNKLPF